MLSIQHNCPHCKTVNGGFTYVFAKLNPVLTNSTSKIWNIVFECNTCGANLICETKTVTSENPNHLNGDIKKIDLFSICEIYPREVLLDIPEHLPNLAANAFKEGLDNLPRSPNAAAAMFRRSLELGLKFFDPDLKRMNLVDRIDELHEMGKITDALKEWAHQVRLDGNLALHDLDEFSISDAQQLQLFTKYILVYLFTLPEQILLAKQTKN